MRAGTTRWAALLTATAIVLYLCWMMLQPFVDVLLWAIVLAIVAFPVYTWARDRKGWPSHWAAIATTALVVLVVLIPVTFLTAAIVHQGTVAVQAVQQGMGKVLSPESKALQWLDRFIDVEPLRNPKMIAERFSQLGGIVAGRTLGVLGGIVGGVVQAFLILFTLYYLLRDADRILGALRGALPLTDEQSSGIFRRTEEVITATVVGVLAIAAIQGVLGMIAFLIVGLPSPVLWGAVMFILATVPMMGAFIVWVPAAIYLAVTRQWGSAVFLTAWGLLVIGMVDNLLRPRLVGQRARLHELVIFFSVLGGLKVFGVLGLFVGPVVAAIGWALLDVVRQANSEPELLTTVPVPQAGGGEASGSDGATEKPQTVSDPVSAPSPVRPGSQDRPRGKKRR